VELMQRVNPKGERVWVVINHGATPETVDVGAGSTDLLTGESGERITLAAHGVAMVEPGKR